MRSSIISLLTILLGTGYCTSSSQSTTGEERSEMKIAAANNQFGFDLFQQLLEQDKGKNVFFSPLSVACALALTYNGAAGVTKEEMQRVLKLSDLTGEQINEESADLLKSLRKSDPQVELAIANSLWARQGVNFQEEFVARNRQYFGAEIASIDFADPQAKATINHWVSQNTRGKIPSIIDQIDSQMVLYLINAIYFKGLWTKKFDQTLTRNEPFHLSSGSQKELPLMSQSGSYRYFRGERFQAVSLPYGKGGTSLYLFLPDQGHSLEELLKSFTHSSCEHWLNGFRSTPGDLKLPRFKMEYEKSLNSMLQALGMETAFSPARADFSGMRQQREIYISEVRHKAIVEVNEEGTEAAAATSVGIRATSLKRPEERFSFIADHPFLMIIRDEQTGANLFMGAVVDPR